MDTETRHVGPVVIEVEWPESALPRYVGPFTDRAAAEEWMCRQTLVREVLVVWSCIHLTSPDDAAAILRSSVPSQG